MREIEKFEREKLEGVNKKMSVVVLRLVAAAS